MLWSREAVRDNVRNRDGKRVFYLAKGDILSSDAKDFLTRERIEILPADQARPERYRLLNGGYMEEKPEHMTHLSGDILVPKTHPRIVLRGKVDLLEAELLLCCAFATGEFRAGLEEALEFTRQMLRHEVLDEPVTQLHLGGMDEKEIRLRSHRPQDFYGQPHFMPGPADGNLLLQINRARSLARQTELAVAAAFPEGRQDLLQGYNRLSSFLYLLMIKLKKTQNEKAFPRGEGVKNL